MSRIFLGEKVDRTIRSRSAVLFTPTIRLQRGSSGLPEPASSNLGSFSLSFASPDGKLSWSSNFTPTWGKQAPEAAAHIFDAQRNVEADADGRFEFLGVWAGLYRLSASHAEHLAGEDRECALASGEELQVDLVLPRGAKVAGVVLDPEGKPAPNATVAAVRTGDEQQRVQADAEGRFAIVGLSPGELDLVANDEAGSAVTSLRGLALANGTEIGDLVLRLGTGGALFGRIVDGMGAPIEGASISVHSKLSSSSQSNTDSAADGSYRLERLLLGEHQLSIQAPGYLPFEQDDLLLDGALRRDFALERGASLEGTIYAPDGSPQPGALVFLFHGDDLEEQVTADGEGRYRLEGLRPGTCQVYVRSEDYAASVRASRELALGTDVARFDLKLRPSGIVRGIVRDVEGRPLAGVEVNGQTEPAGKGRREATTGPDGRFELPRLYPDQYRIYAGNDPAKGVVIDATAGGELESIELRYAP